MDLSAFDQLLKSQEIEQIDWKEDFSSALNSGNKDPNWEKEKTVLIKDIACIANSVIRSNGFLVLGVVDHKTHREVKGISKSWDDAIFQQWPSSYVHPKILFSYSELDYQPSKRVGIFEINPSSEFPHVFINNSPGIFSVGQVWHRTGSSNKIALYEDLKRMFKGDEPIIIDKIDGNPIYEDVKTFYSNKGREVAPKPITSKDTSIHTGYEIAYYPNTRREILISPSSGKIDMIIMLKPVK